MLRNGRYRPNFTDFLKRKEIINEKDYEIHRLKRALDIYIDEANSRMGELKNKIADLENELGILDQSHVNLDEMFPDSDEPYDVRCFNRWYEEHLLGNIGMSHRETALMAYRQGRRDGERDAPHEGDSELKPWRCTGQP